jgi:hypothetical protein
MIPGVAFGTAVDEAALTSAVSTLAAANGWTVTSVGTTPANSVWYQSPGEDGTSNIVGGLQPDTVGRQMRGWCAADLDTTGLVNANVGGYVNNDAAGVGHSVQAETVLAWPARDLVSVYNYAVVANRDAIAVIVVYISGGNAAQGAMYIGKTEPMAGRYFQTYAKAKIASVAAGSNGNQRLVTLDRNITAMLKDTGPGGLTYPSDPAQQTLLFQTVGGPATDFAMAERQQIVPGTLATSGGVTVFEVNVAKVSSKLFGAGQRYANNRGTGDIVRMMAEPNITAVGAATLGGEIFEGSPTPTQVLASWDAFGGQSAALAPLVANQESNSASTAAPDPLTNRTPFYSAYLLTNTSVTNILAQPSSEGQKDIGRLYHFILVPNQSQPNFAFFRVNADAARRYRVLSLTGGAGGKPPSPRVAGSTVVQYGIGPGW